MHMMIVNCTDLRKCLHAGKRLLFVLIAVFAILCGENTISYAKVKVPKWAKSGKISHAGGGINNTSYTNSLEALTNTLKNNTKVVELDFRYTKDGTLVCLHSWNDIGGKKLKTSKFLSSKIKKKFTPMTAETALKMLIESGNTYLVVDVKGSNVAGIYGEIDRICTEYDVKQNEAMQAEGVDTAPCTKGSEFRKKIIPQIYSKAEYTKVKQVYDYKNWIFTVYKLKLTKESEFKSLAAFCKKKGIQTVTVPKGILTRNIVRILQKKNLVVATHTVNTVSEYQKYKKMKVNVIYTDFLQ